MLVALPLTASAQNLKQREVINHSKAMLAEKLAATNKLCGSHVVMDVDWNSFIGMIDSPENNPNQQDPYSPVENVTDAMESICRVSDEGKQAIATKLKTVKVSHSTTESEKYSNGVLTYTVPYTGTGDDKLKAYLKDNL